VELERRKGWQFSSGDERCNVELARVMSDLAHPLLVAFVIAVARCSQRVPRGHYRGMKNTIQLSLGGCRVIVAAYRSLESGRLTKTNTRLRLAGIAH